MTLITDLKDLVKEIVLAIWGADKISDIGFWKWLLTFVAVYVLIRAYMYVVGGD